MLTERAARPLVCAYILQPIPFQLMVVIDGMKKRKGEKKKKMETMLAGDDSIMSEEQAAKRHTDSWTSKGPFSLHHMHSR